MKLNDLILRLCRYVVRAILIILVTLAAATADAAPYRHHRHGPCHGSAHKASKHRASCRHARRYRVHVADVNNVPVVNGVQLALGRTGVPFGSNFWGQPLPGSTPANPNSATYVNEIVQALANSVPVSRECYLSTTNAPPIYVVPANQPHVQVTRQYGYNRYLYQNVLAGGIPIPPFAVQSGSSDRTMIIYQPSTNTLWEMWRVQRDSNGNWQVGWAGKMTDVSQSDGIWPKPGGTSATGDALLGVVTRIEELQDGQIDHPIDLELPRTIVLGRNVLPANTPGANVSYSWPADRLGDGVSPNPLAIPEGLRFRLDPSLNLNDLQLSPVAHMIAVAAQKYGFLVENTGPDCNIKLGNPNPYIAAGLPDPYKALFGSDYGPGYSAKVMANFPWSHLQALPFNYGEH